MSHQNRVSTRYTTAAEQKSTLLSIVTLLVLIGIVAIYSASSVFSLKTYQHSYYFAVKQALGALLMVICGWTAHTITLRALIPYARMLCYATLAVMALALILSNYGTTIHGSTRWISIGYLHGQPVECLKIVLIPALAASIIEAMRQSMLPLRGIIKIAPLLIGSVAILLMQPDFGQSMLLLITTLCMLLIAYQTITYFWYASAASSIAAVCLILYKPYRMRRLIAFIAPWDDPQGAGFQLVQSLIAIGSGGIRGLGIGNSQQKFFYLPMQHTDFIFSIIGEETGIIGTSIILLLYGAFTYQGYKIALAAEEPVLLLTVAGYTTMITGQTIINLAVTTGLAPTKGIGLPFISYGLSSLIAHGCIVGLMLSTIKTRATTPL